MGQQRDTIGTIPGRMAETMPHLPFNPRDSIVPFKSYKRSAFNKTNNKKTLF